MRQVKRDIATFAIETHGCKLNQADSLVLAREFAEAGLTQVGEDRPADVYVVNSCTVTHVADRKARQSLRAARRRNPQATIVATGCYAERSPELLRAMAEIDLVFGNVDKARLGRAGGRVARRECRALRGGRRSGLHQPASRTHQGDGEDTGRVQSGLRLLHRAKGARQGAQHTDR